MIGMRRKKIIRLPKNIWVQRFLFLLATGVSLGLSSSPKQYFRTLKTIPNEWRKINRSHIYRLSRSLNYRGYIKYKKSNDQIHVSITPKGKQYLKRLEYSDIQLADKGTWDGRWRLILFDIPEPRKRSRDALRRKLKELGCIEVQKSVFAWPFDCWKEIKQVASFLNLEPYIVFAEAKIKSDKRLKRSFNIK